ncbi:hypothetical protein B0H14DRAFT_3460074 [Mycena olivaceomarginata]|nr:hypothetical protein B0H14DRAFT_3460074 [Mycena olivaceomarginata]
MSREDRRPLSQVPEDSVISYMHPLSSSYPPTFYLEESFTLPPYNPTDQNFFHAYYSSNADTYLDEPLLLDWAHYQSSNWDFYQPKYAQDFNNVPDTEYPYCSSVQPLQPPLPVPAPSLFPLPAFEPSFDPYLPNPCPDSQALSYCEALSHNLAFLPNPDQPIPYDCDLDTILNCPEYFPQLFTNAENCEEFYVPRPQPANPAVRPVQVQRQKPAARKSGSNATPTATPSEPEVLSRHEKNRLYVECLEHYVHYLHELFAQSMSNPCRWKGFLVIVNLLVAQCGYTILLHLGKSTDVIHVLTAQEQDKLNNLQLRQVLSGVRPQALGTEVYDGHHPVTSPYSDSAGTSSDPNEFLADTSDLDMSSFFVYPT